MGLRVPQGERKRRFLLWLEQGRNRAYAPGHIRQGLEVVTKTIKQDAEVFDVRRHRHARQGGNFVILRTDTILRGDVAQELDSRGSYRVLFGESFDLWGRKRARKAARAATYLMRESSDPI